ncbi:MAG: hypothetical protein K6T55_12455 [Syntrophobacterales bacterium]|nr:hypothetical protein [Syntrophobacterales bacterium]
MKALLILVWLASVAGGWLGCNSFQTRTFPAPSFNPAPLAAPTLDQRRTVLVAPPTDAYRSQRVGVLLFRHPPHLPEVSHPLTQVFYQRLLTARPFREVVFIPRAYGSLAEALAVGRQERVDLLLLGEAPYFLDGGTVGTTAVQVDLKVVEVKSGHLLWYLSDALRATPRPVIDLIVTETRPEPTPDVYALAGMLAERMCQTLAAGRLASR